MDPIKQYICTFMASRRRLASHFNRRRRDRQAKTSGHVAHFPVANGSLRGYIRQHIVALDAERQRRHSAATIDSPGGNKMARFADKVVVVTGGGGGIGGATCKAFAREGAAVGVFDLNLEAARKIAEDIRATGGRAQAFGCDIANRVQVDAAVCAVEADLGPIDALVNNAGWDVFRPFVKTEPAQWEKLIAINLTGALHMHHAVLPGMAARKRGRIVNIASDAARVGSSGEAVYAACKGGLVAFSKTIAREHSRHGITVNVVCPGPTDTALFAEYKEGAGNPEKLMEAFTRSIPLGRIGKPDDLPGAILFFASDDAAYVTGQVLSVSGGLTMGG
jgi:2-hydroxycyclohexanecarboxyl-CoA dehydrogenase